MDFRKVFIDMGGKRILKHVFLLLLISWIAGFLFNNSLLYVYSSLNFQFVYIIKFLLIFVAIPIIYSFLVSSKFSYKQIIFIALIVPFLSVSILILYNNYIFFSQIQNLSENKDLLNIHSSIGDFLGSNPMTALYMSICYDYTIKDIRLNQPLSCPFPEGLTYIAAPLIYLAAMMLGFYPNKKFRKKS